MGAAAVRRFELNPVNTVFCFEKLLGRKYSDPVVQAFLKQLPYKVVNDPADPEKIVVEVEHGGGVMQYTPVAVCSILFNFCATVAIMIAIVRVYKKMDGFNTWFKWWQFCWAERCLLPKTFAGVWVRKTLCVNADFY